MTNYFKKYIKQDIFKNIQYLDQNAPQKNSNTEKMKWQQSQAK